MKAVILAAGKGTRMGELTAHVPKPMKEVEGKPILQHIVEGLRDAAGVRDFFIVIGWCGHIITDHFGDGSAFGVRVAYGEQKVQDGTGKAPGLARDWVGKDKFLFTYGDILITPPTDYARLAEAFREDGVIAVKDGEDLTKGGAVVLNEQGFMIDLVEKAAVAPKNAFYNAGIYLLKPRIFEFTSRLQKSPRGEYEFTDALRASVAAGDKLRGVTLTSTWADVRDPGVLAELNKKP
jgi:dTDP-glucose pyrophosphorylase